jgi:hypothetical protein
MITIRTRDLCAIFSTLFIFLWLSRDSMGQQEHSAEADNGGDVWTVPLGGGFGKLFRLGQILPLEGHPIAMLPMVF